MKRIVLLAVAIIVTGILISSCDLSGGTYIKYSDWVDIQSWTAPDTVVVNVAFQVEVVGYAPNSCWHSLKFATEKEKDPNDYLVGLLSTFENRGENCIYEKVYADTLLTYTPTQTGMYRFYFLSKNLPAKKDSVIVVASLK